MEKKNKGNNVLISDKIYSEIENLTELVEREGASVGILLMAASGDSAIETDEVCLFMRDCSDRVDKMKESLDRIEQLVR